VEADRACEGHKKDVVAVAVVIAVIVFMIQNLPWSGIMQQQPQKKSLGIMVLGACIHLSLYKNFSLSFIFFNLSYLFIVNVIDLACFGHTQCVPG